MQGIEWKNNNYFLFSWYSITYNVDVMSVSKYATGLKINFH